MYCPKCGTLLSDDAIYCRKCGSKRRHIPNQKVINPDSEQTMKTSIPFREGDSTYTKQTYEYFKTQPNENQQQIYDASQFHHLSNRTKPIDKQTEDLQQVNLPWNQVQSVSKNSNKIQPSNISPMKQKKSHKKTYFALFATLVVASVVMFFILYITKDGQNRIEIPLANYVEISYGGYDTLGEAKLSLNEESFRNDYEKILHYDIDTLLGKELQEKYQDPCEGFLHTLKIGLDKERELSNGDVVTCEWTIDQELEAAFDCRLKYSNLEWTISGLEPVTIFDPFKEMNVSAVKDKYSGKIKATCNSTEAFASDISYVITPNKNLKNGDEVTISLSDKAKKRSEELFETSKIRFIRTEMKYEVKELTTYVTDIDEISEEYMEQLKELCEYAITSEIRDGFWKDYITTNHMELENVYFIKEKDGVQKKKHNVIYIVYKVNVDTVEVPNHKSVPMDFYTGIIIQNLESEESETISKGIQNVKCFRPEVDYDHYDYETQSYYDAIKSCLPGYEKLDIIQEEINQKYKENYEIQKMYE